MAKITHIFKAQCTNIFSKRWKHNFLFKIVLEGILGYIFIEISHYKQRNEMIWY